MNICFNKNYSVPLLMVNFCTVWAGRAHFGLICTTSSKNEIIFWILLLLVITHLLKWWIFYLTENILWLLLMVNFGTVWAGGAHFGPLCTTPSINKIIFWLFFYSYFYSYFKFMDIFFNQIFFDHSYEKSLILCLILHCALLL